MRAWLFVAQLFRCFKLSSEQGPRQNMKYIKKSLTNVLSAAIVVMALVAVAIWQFYLFISFKNAHGGAGMLGGTQQLWLGIGAVLIACIAGLFLFSVFLRYDRKDDPGIAS